MTGPSEGPSPPTHATVRALRSGLETLRRFPAGDSAAEGVTTAEERLRLLERTLRELRSEIDRLGPWFLSFVGSSLVITLAVKAIDEALDPIDLHVHRLHEGPAHVSALVERPVRKAADRLEAVVALLPGHVRLADRLSDRERAFGDRVRAMPRRLRRRFYVGVVLGALFLVSVAVAALILLVPSVARALGVSQLLTRYAPASASVVVVALLFFTGFRLILGSVWLTRTIAILPEYESARVDEAREGIRRQETEVLDRVAPRPSKRTEPRRLPDRGGQVAESKPPAGGPQS